MTRHFRAQNGDASNRKPDSWAPLTPVLGTSGALGHVLLGRPGTYRAFDRHDRELGTFTDPAAAVTAILTAGST